MGAQDAATDSSSTTTAVKRRFDAATAHTVASSSTSPSRAWGFSIWAHNAEYGIIRRGNTAIITDEAGNTLKNPLGDPVQFNEGNWENSLAKARRHIESQPGGRVGHVNARDQTLPDPHNNKPSMQKELIEQEKAQLAEAKWSRHDDKHMRATKSPEQAKALSTGPEAPSQYLPGQNIEQLERLAVENGALVQKPGTSTTKYFYYDTGKVVGYDGGKPATWIRAEITSGTLHGHPLHVDNVPASVK